MKKLLVIPILFISISSLAQRSIGIETQTYPAGIIPSIRFDVGISENLNFNSRIGYNFTDRRDWGKHDNEKGGGFGFGLGIEKTNFLTENLSLNFRTDLWFMEIDWKDTKTICGIVPPCFKMPISGETNIVVLQPTLGLAYQLPISDQFFLKPSLSFGYEVNVKTEGEPVGEGAILLIGVQFGKYFK